MNQLEQYLNRVINADCLDVLRELPDNSVDLVVTDPPYGINFDGAWLSSLNVKRGKPANTCDNKIEGDDSQFDIALLLRFDRRIIFGFPYIVDPNATGWLVWDKQPGVDRRGLVTPVEVASSTTWKGYDIIRCMWGGYFRDNNEVRFKHPTQKPLRLIETLIKENSNEGDIILDPFLGSGTTAIACERLGRQWIGIEIDSEYCKIAEKRIENERAQGKLFQPKELEPEQEGLSFEP